MGSGLLLEDYWHYPSRGARQAHGGWRVAACWSAGQPVHAWPCISMESQRKMASDNKNRYQNDLIVMRSSLGGKGLFA
eukprot:COSAG01_NODE_6735_length_3523_cov_21.917932_4_plen_77_part_01